MTKILFVCNGNAQRSPTFERYFKKEFKDLENVKDYEFRSAGIYSGYPFMIDEPILEWADKVYVMDMEQYKHIYTHYSSHINKTSIIGISDQYNPDDPELIEIIEFWFFNLNKGKFP